MGGSEPRCSQVKNRNTITESNITSYSIAGIKTEERTASYVLICPRRLTTNTLFSVLQKLWVWQKLRVHLRDALSVNVVTNTSQTVKLSCNIMETPQMFDELLIWLQLWASNTTTRLSWCPSFSSLILLVFCLFGLISVSFWTCWSNIRTKIKDRIKKRFVEDWRGAEM